ncbi:MAG: PAS domain S-box protein, partial [Planctomycetota bacterium]
MKSLRLYLSDNVDLAFNAIELASCGFYLYPLDGNDSDAITLISETVRETSSQLLMSRQSFESLGHQIPDEQVSREFWRSLFHEDDVVEVEEKISAAIRRESDDLRLCYRLRRADGTYRYTSETGRLIRGENRPPVWMGVLGDVDAEVRTTRQLEFQTLEMQTILDTIPTYIWVKDRDSKILQVNRSAALASGMRVSDIEGRLTAEVYPRMAANYNESDQAILKKEDVFRRAEFLHSANGQIRQMLVDKYRVEHEASDQPRILVVGTDVTEIQEARVKLEKSEAQFRLLFDSSPIGMLLVDCERRIRLCNAQANSAFGYPNGTQGMLIEELIPSRVWNACFSHQQRNGDHDKEGLVQGS